MSLLEMVDPVHAVISASSVAPAFDGALKHLDDSLEACNGMLAAVPGDAGYKVLVNMRLAAGIGNLKIFNYHPLLRILVLEKAM